MSQCHRPSRPGGLPSLCAYNPVPEQLVPVGELTFRLRPHVLRGAARLGYRRAAMIQRMSMADGELTDAGAVAG